LAAAAAVVLAVGAILVFTGGDDEAGGGPALDEPVVTSIAAPSTTVPARVELGPVRASDVTCSSELTDFPCDALIDGDTTTVWSPVGSGEGAEIRVEFDSPVRVTTVVFVNVPGEAELVRNARANEVEIRLTDTGAVTTAELGSGHGPFRVSVTPDSTSGLVIRIVSTYPGEHLNGVDALEELALAEITFAGIGSAP